MLNDQRKKKNGIETCDYTWNPISGCLHGCPYCYMLRMETRFPGTMRPALHEKRLDEPIGKKKPSKIFVGSSGDMWGEWVSRDWILPVLNVAQYAAPEHTYQFLTKNPERYAEFDLSALDNCWFGTTVDGTPKTMKNLDILVRSTGGAKLRFVSFEPLLNEPDRRTLANIYLLDWVIIGADSNRGAEEVPDEWADMIINEARKYDVPVWVKDNYGYPEVIKEFPEIRRCNRVPQIK